VFYELRAKQGDQIALSQWEVAEPVWMHNLGYHEAALAKLGAPDIPARANTYDLIPNETVKNAQLRRFSGKALLHLSLSGAVRSRWKTTSEFFGMAWETCTTGTRPNELSNCAAYARCCANSTGSTKGHPVSEVP
jgi:hypothetical protein